MAINFRARTRDYTLFVAIAFLILTGLITLVAIASSLFPLYFVYVALALVTFLIFIQIDFDLISLFSTHFYIGCIIFLLLPLIIGQVTRGAIRWIPIGALTIQPAEIVRPFLLIFFANYLASEEVSAKRLLTAVFLFSLPFFLILIQPSLGVAILTAVGFIGIILASTIKKKYILFGVIIMVLLAPLAWRLLAPYQKERILTFIEPGRDPYGAGYNSLQSMISVGSGKLFGRGLGKGAQTQLSFLPERHTDFIFASVSEELGLAGGGLLILGAFFLLSRLISYLENSRSPQARAYLSGLFLTLFAQFFVHIGMNMGILPITGIPFPLVSAGGSSLLGTMIALAIAHGSQKG